MTNIKESIEVGSNKKFGRVKFRRIALKLGIGFCFMVALAIFLQFRDVRVDVLEVGTIAKQYVIAQVDFEFFDVDKTSFLQKKAAEEVTPVYKFSQKELAKAEADLQDFLGSRQGLHRKMPQVTFEEFYEYSELFKMFLVETRFLDQKNLNRLKDVDLEPDHPFFFKEAGVIPKQYWSFVQEQVFPRDSKYTALSSMICDFFENRHWTLVEDLSIEKKLKASAAENIPQQYTTVKAGDFILEPGEKISFKHVLMLQSMKNTLAEPLRDATLLQVIGSLTLSFIITFLTGIYLKIYHREIFRSLRKLSLLVVVAIMTLVLAKATEYLILYKGYNLAEIVRYPLVIPFASLLLCVLLGARISLFSSIFLSVIISLGLSIQYDRFLILNLIGAMCTIMFAKHLHKRKDVFEVCGKVWLCLVPVLISFHLMENTLWKIDKLSDFITTFVCLGVMAVLVVGLLPLFETIFKIMTDMTLMEFMDPNNELLRRLSVEAPGTYQHSLVVGNLAEVMARAIGANDLFCRVATLYHDIGKLFNPHYFTENQLGGFNIHQLLTPLESTHVIIAHVQEGELLARKYHLPKGFIDVIRQHHGTTLVYFFYCKQIEQMGGDPSKVNSKLFRYPGPKPRTKEAALIMIADTIEAASRSLDEVNEEIVLEMVDKLISEKAREGQFDECALTFEDLGIAKKVVVKALLVTRHLRIKYPSRS